MALPMQVLFELLPLILFLGAYLYKGIYFAIGTLMVAMPIGFVIKYIRTQKVDKMYMWSTIFLLVFGSADSTFAMPISFTGSQPRFTGSSL
jgi:intracellular septation protein A